MAFERLTTDLDHVQELDDEPNDIGGLSPAELKRVFDQAPNEIKVFLNGFIDAIEALSAAANIGAQVDGIAGTTIAEALADLKYQLDNAAFSGILTRNSINDSSMMTDAVVTPQKVSFNYAGSESKGGAANSVKSALSFADGSTYDGSEEKAVNWETVGAPKADIKYAASDVQGGPAASVKQEITFDDSGLGASSGTKFNGSTARTISRNTIGAQKKQRIVEITLWANATIWNVAVAGLLAGSPTNQSVDWTPSTDAGFVLAQNCNVRAVNPNPTAGYIQFKADAAPTSEIKITLRIFDE